MADSFLFTEDFQDSIIAHFVAHPSDFLVYGDLLKPSYFQGSQATVVAYALFDYVKVYGKMPSWPVLKQLSVNQNQKLGLSETDEVVRYIEKLREQDTDDTAFILKQVIGFAKERATVNAIKKAAEMLREKKVPEDGFVKLFQDALQVGTNLDDLGSVLHVDYAAIIDRITKVDYGTPTGYPQFDKIWRRGWGPGWLIVPVAPPKRFKTAMLMNLALNIVGPMIGGDVLYYSCEITGDLAIARMLNNLTQQGMNFLYDNPEKFKESSKEAIHIGVAGKLVVKSYPAGQATISTLRNHAKVVCQQYGIKKLKAIFIDYADTVRPSIAYEKEYMAQGAVYTEARAFGAEFKCPVIMPDRVTKEATDLHVPNMKAFQGAFAKGGIVDASFGLCMTESEYSENVLRSFVFINRHGPAFQHFRGRVDPETMTIDIGEEIPYDPDGNNKGHGQRKLGKRSKDIEGVADVEE